MMCMWAAGVSRLKNAASSPLMFCIECSPSSGSAEMVGPRETCRLMVSWVFLAVAIWGAGWTLISFHPPRRPPLVMGIGFFAAWSTTELAPVHIAWQLVGTVVFVWLGALDMWIGWVALGVTLVSWFGLAASVKGSLTTDRVFVDALRDGL